MQMRQVVLSVLAVTLACATLLSAGEGKGTLQLSLSADNTDILEREIILRCRYLSSNTREDNIMRLGPDDRVSGNEMMQITDMEQQLSGDHLQFELNNSIIYPNSTLLHNFSVGRDHMMDYVASFQLNPYEIFYGNFTCTRNCTAVSNNVLLAYVPFNISLPSEEHAEVILGMGISLSIAIAVTVMLCFALIVTCYKTQQSSQNCRLKNEVLSDHCQRSSDPPSSILRSSNSSIIQFTTDGYAVPRCTLAQLASGSEVGKQNYSNAKLNVLSKRTIVKALKYLLHPSDCSNPNCLCKEVKKEYFTLLNEMKPPNIAIHPQHESEYLVGMQTEHEALQGRSQTCSLVTEDTHSRSVNTSKDNTSSYCKDHCCGLDPSLSTIHYPKLSPATSPILEMSHVDPVDRVTFDSKGGHYFNQDHGIGLKVPPGAVPEGDQVTIEIGASLSCPILFPSGTRPVSPMLSVCVTDNPNYQFLKPVKLRLAHCLDISTKEDVTDLEVRFLKSGHNLFCFHEAEGKSTFQPGTHCGILNTTHFCCFCIGANKKKADLTKISYRLIKVVPNSTSSLRWKAHYCITYFLPTCLRALEKQYCPSKYTIQSLQRFKFGNCASSDLPYVAVSFERRVVGGWNLALQSPDKIYAKDIDFWEIEPSELEQMELEELYPPRFVIDVCGTQALTTGQVWVYFSGMTTEFKSELILDANRGLPQHNFSTSSPWIGLPYSYSTPTLTQPLTWPSNWRQPHSTVPSQEYLDSVSSVAQHSQGSTTSGSVRSLDSTGTGSPSDKDLMNKIAAVVPTKWRHVGLQLGLDQAQLDMIEQKYSFSRDSIACFGEVFMEWKKRMTSPVLWSTLITALKSPLVGENTLAHKLQLELDGSTESNSKYSME